MALQTNVPDAVHFLDKETGEINFYYDGMLTGHDDVDEDFDIDEYLEDDRFVVIQGIHSSESYSVMRDFIYSLPDGAAQERLADAIRMSKPFRRFKDTLFHLGDLLDQWYQFQEEAHNRKAQEWLDENEIDAELVHRQPVPKTKSVQPGLNSGTNSPGFSDNIKALVRE